MPTGANKDADAFPD